MNAALKENMEMAARSECPIFLRKTYHMICSCDNEISKWADDGMSFYVKQVEIFSSTVLPEYFKHSNFSSFVRQLNFYGFTKDRNETILNGVKPKQSDWHFRHEDFKRDNPKLLVKIKRRLASHHSGTSSRKKVEGGVGAGGGAVVMDAKNQKEMRKEIEGLSETMNKMESTMGKLTEMMKSIQIEPSEDAIKSKSAKVVARTSSARISSSTSAVPSTKTITSITASTGIKTAVKESKRLTGSSKKQKILLNDAQLFSSNLGSISIKQQQQLRAVVSSGRSGRVSPVSLMVSKHEASIDLPDLGLAGTSDADLLMEDKSSSSSSSSSKASLVKRPLRIPLSSRRGSRSGTGTGMNTCDTDINMNASLAEVDQIFTSIEESDIHMTSTISSQEQTSIIYQDRLPDLVADDTPSLPQQQQHKSDARAPPPQHQQRFSRNILDSAALVNLEKSLAVLPIQERINFVQGIMMNISGLDDLRQQGLTIVEKSKSEESNGTGTSQSLSRAEQVVKSGIDTSLLSELESLLLRVGLKILIIPTSSSLSLQSSNTIKSSGSSCANSKKKPKSKKDSSSYEYVQIEA